MQNHSYLSDSSALSMLGTIPELSPLVISNKKPKRQVRPSMRAANVLRSALADEHEPLFLDSGATFAHKMRAMSLAQKISAIARRPHSAASPSAACSACHDKRLQREAVASLTETPPPPTREEPKPEKVSLLDMMRKSQASAQEEAKERAARHTEAELSRVKDELARLHEQKDDAERTLRECVEETRRVRDAIKRGRVGTPANSDLFKMVIQKGATSFSGLLASAEAAQEASAKSVQEVDAKINKLVTRQNDLNVKLDRLTGRVEKEASARASRAAEETVQVKANFLEVLMKSRKDASVPKKRSSALERGGVDASLAVRKVVVQLPQVIATFLPLGTAEEDIASALLPSRHEDWVVVTDELSYLREGAVLAVAFSKKLSAVTVSGVQSMDGSIILKSSNFVGAASGVASMLRVTDTLCDPVVQGEQSRITAAHLSGIVSALIKLGAPSMEVGVVVQGSDDVLRKVSSIELLGGEHAVLHVEDLPSSERASERAAGLYVGELAEGLKTHVVCGQCSPSLTLAGAQYVHAKLTPASRLSNPTPSPILVLDGAASRLGTLRSHNVIAFVDVLAHRSAPAVVVEKRVSAPSKKSEPEPTPTREEKPVVVVRPPPPPVIPTQSKPRAASPPRPRKAPVATPVTKGSFFALPPAATARVVAAQPRGAAWRRNRLRKRGARR